VDTGFRIGEALRVASTEIDWDNGMVPAWETKGDDPRQVPMTARVKAILKAREHLTHPLGCSLLIRQMTTGRRCARA
jgi:integrase